MLGFVICGIEHSGTTLCSDVFRQVPGIDAGFELGVLLADTPRHFPNVESHYPYLYPGWGLDEADAAYACATDDFAEFYRRLQARAKFLPADTSIIFDKTPRYLAHLDACLAKIGVPFIATYKDPRAIVHSDYMRAGAPEFFKWFEAYAPPKLAYVRQAYAQYQRHTANKRVLFLALETICLQAGPSCEAMFAHVGQTFDPAYLVLRNLRYPNTRNESISAGVPFAYRHEMTPAMITAIEQTFSTIKDWFY